MTEKAKRFGVEYLKDLNATQAAIRAGFSEKTAAAIGWEYLRKPEIKKFISEQVEEALNCNKMTLRKRIVEELETMAFDPMNDEDSKLRHNDKLKAIELLGKYDAMFTDNVKVTVDKSVIDDLREKYENK